MFIGRDSELESLDNVYSKDGFGMTIVYGRRRIGKTTLLAEFIKDKKAIFYVATKVGAEKNQELFSKRVLDVIAPDYSQANFSSLEAVLDILTKKLGDLEEKLVLVIDELPCWMEKDAGLLPIFHKYMDTKWRHKNLMLILAGSDLRFMEKIKDLGSEDLQIRLEAFDYSDSSLFVPGYTPEEKAICYGVTGGVAKYLALFDSTRSLDDNIKRLFFHRDGYLLEETQNLLIEEFADVTMVNNIIERVACRENSLSDIATSVGKKDSTVLYSLEKLIDLGLLERKKCVEGEKNKKKTQYVLKDHMFRFWYEYIPKAVSVIEMGQGDIYYQKVVKPNLHDFMGSVFEEMFQPFSL